MIEIPSDVQLQNLPTHGLEVCEGVIKITGNLFRETSSTFCCIRTVVISEFLFLKSAILDVSKTRCVNLLSILESVCHWCCTFLQMGIQNCILMLLVTLSSGIYIVHNHDIDKISPS